MRELTHIDRRMMYYALLWLYQVNLSSVLELHLTTNVLVGTSEMPRSYGTVGSDRRLNLSCVNDVEICRINAM
jgi:hypothetical protein